MRRYTALAVAVGALPVAAVLVPRRRRQVRDPQGHDCSLRRIRRTRRGLCLPAALLAVALLAPAARADHVHPAVTATLQMGAKVRDCAAPGICGGSRRATVSWTSSCGPGVPDSAVESVIVTINGIRPSGRRFVYDEEPLEDEPPLTGSMTMTVRPGVRFEGEVEVTCYLETQDAEGNVTEHRGTGSGTTAQAYLPPRLANFGVGYGSWCGPLAESNRRFRTLQARESYDLLYRMRYSGTSLFKPGVAAKRQVKLFARGAGVRVKRAPSPSILRSIGEIGTYVSPRRAGTLKIWATIGGNRTNTLRIKVAPKC